MKIIKFSANNFRGITGGLKNNTVDFNNSDTIFIFGQNNVGKSTFLDAYEFFYNAKTPVEDDFYRKNPSLTIEFEMEIGIDEFDLEYIKESQPKKVDSFKSFVSSDNTIKIRRVFSASRGKKFEIEKAVDTTLNPTSGKWEDSSYASIGLPQVFQYLLPRPIKIKAMPTEEELESVINEILASKAKDKLSEEKLQELTEAQNTVKKLQEIMYNPVSVQKYKDEVNIRFTKLFPDISIEIEEADKVKWTEDKFGKKFSIHFEKKSDDGSKDESVPTSHVSVGHGAVRSAIFSLLLLRDVADERKRTESRKEYLVLFEEPELFLHPRLMRELRELIYEVSDEHYPYQVLCASHSPNMIDISKPNSSLVRMTKEKNGTTLYQLGQTDLEEVTNSHDKDVLKKKMYEVLRFNPHICESFYADEVLLVEGPTEEILIRAILQKEESRKHLFIVNCGSVTNIPFYQEIYSRFSIKYHVICDTDGQLCTGTDQWDNPVFSGGIQKSIYTQFSKDCGSDPKLAGILHTHEPTFEPAHNDTSVEAKLRLNPINYKDGDGKPYNANLYWLNILEPNYSDLKIESVPIIKAVKKILAYSFPLNQETDSKDPIEEVLEALSPEQ